MAVEMQVSGEGLRGKMVGPVDWPGVMGLS